MKAIGETSKEVFLHCIGLEVDSKKDKDKMPKGIVYYLDYDKNKK